MQWARLGIGASIISLTFGYLSLQVQGIKALGIMKIITFHAQDSRRVTFTVEVFHRETARILVPVCSAGFKDSILIRCGAWWIKGGKPLPEYCNCVSSSLDTLCQKTKAFVPATAELMSSRIEWSNTVCQSPSQNNLLPPYLHTAIFSAQCYLMNYKSHHVSQAKPCYQYTYPLCLSSI